eukprot:GFYU01016763.1.p1 GENE.GFYU01016763.1~~GFYU01016763.1.p1  ORF type:complete len:353 (-),score=90.06 GFYU01016763.1:50-1108(-)
MAIDDAIEFFVHHLKVLVGDSCEDVLADNIVVEYFRSFIEEQLSTSGGQIDEEDWRDVLSGYFPEYDNVDDSKNAEFVQKVTERYEAKVIANAANEGPSVTVAEVAPHRESVESAASTVDSEDALEEKENIEPEDEEAAREASHNDSVLQLLREMCPNHNPVTISTIFLKCDFDIERTVETLLSIPSTAAGVKRSKKKDAESDAAETAGKADDSKATGPTTSKNTRNRSRSNSEATNDTDAGDEDDGELNTSGAALKDEILRRYDVITKIEHYPTEKNSKALKNQRRSIRHTIDAAVGERGKAKVRYRDGVVATQRGEKTVTEATKEDDEMKKTYISLKVVTKGKRGPGTKG